MNDVLIAEDLLLLLTDDRNGKLLVAPNQADIALGGAMLIELALAQRVDVAREDGVIRKGRLLVTDADPTSDSLLDEALGRIADREAKKPKDVVAALGKGVRPRLHARLAERGQLHEQTAKILGMFPSHRWPSSDSTHEDSLRAPLATALQRGGTDDPRLAALIALLHALKAVAKVVDPASVGITKRAAGRTVMLQRCAAWREFVDVVVARLTAGHR